MNRRQLLAASASGIAGGVGGCLAGHGGRDAPTADAKESNDAGGSEEISGPGVDLRFLGVYAADADREFVDGEYVALENGSDGPVPLSGYVVEYPGDRRHRIEDVTLEPGAQFVLVIGRGADSTLPSSPPVYLRYTGPADDGERDAGAAPPELDENGTVRVRDAGGTVVTEVRYENFGCDGGTVTTAAGAEIECLHPT